MNDFKLFTKENLGDYYDLISPSKELEDFVLEEYRTRKIAPIYPDIFRALKMTPLKLAKVVILGQDPYPTLGAADGLAFSSRSNSAPMSIRNMFKELNNEYETSVKIDKGLNADLSDWAKQGVLLLNTVLTCRIGEPKSHFKKGWERVTDDIIRGIDNRETPTVFLLFGDAAQKKAELIKKSFVIRVTHPSPLSARRGFFGSGCFKACNQILIRTIGTTPIDWIGRRVDYK